MPTVEGAELRKSKNNSSAMRIGLYGAVSTASEMRPIIKSPLNKFKGFCARVIDVVNWRLTGRARLHFYHWNRFDGTNKGDTAIRETIKDSVTRVFTPSPVEFVELEWGELASIDIEEANRNWDALIIGGSGYIQTGFQGDLAPRLLADLEVLTRLNIPKILYGVGWNTLMSKHQQIPQVTESAKQSIRQLLSAVDLLSVRDESSAKLLQELSDKPVYLTSDPALFSAMKQGYRDIKRSPDRLQVGLNFALHGPQAAARFEQKFDAYCDILRAIENRYSVNFHHVPHSDTERVVPAMFRARGIRMEAHNPAPAQLIALYKQLDIHISEMMHSSILAIGAGTPTLNMAYDIKNVGFYDLLGLSHLCHPIWSLDTERFLQSIDYAIKESEKIKTSIETRKSQLGAAQSEFLEKFSERVRGRRACSQSS
ncbi:MAG TPA: polysaccharide pyruvyl transferase family protein [Rhizomicrobium sp.]|nr:polysaccharide pyruvyl transferase family protein [Rhizomicrobium sp.]